MSQQQKMPLPEGYSLAKSRNPVTHNMQVIILRNGKPYEYSKPGDDRTLSRYMTEQDATESAWGDYNQRVTNAINRHYEDKAYHVLAWTDYTEEEAKRANEWLKQEGKPESEYIQPGVLNGKIYTVGHITFPHVVDQSFKPISINSHSANYEIAGMICEHCSMGAVDDDILSKYRLLFEGWNVDGFYDDDENEEEGEE